jgi:hypothetical protein
MKRETKYTETERNEMKRNDIYQNEAKRNETKWNVTKFTETKRNGTKQNEMYTKTGRECTCATLSGRLQNLIETLQKEANIDTSNTQMYVRLLS